MQTAGKKHTEFVVYIRQAKKAFEGEQQKTPFVSMNEVDADFCRGFLRFLATAKNNHVKKLVKAVGIEKKVSFHCTRHLQSSFLLKTKDLQKVAVWWLTIRKRAKFHIFHLLALNQKNAFLYCKVNSNLSKLQNNTLKNKEKHPKIWSKYEKLFWNHRKYLLSIIWMQANCTIVSAVSASNS